MKKLAAAVVGALFAGLMTGSTKAEASVKAEREARMQKLDSVTESSPVCFSQSQQSGLSSPQWHSSHYSHSSHSSHYSHSSHRSGW